MTYFDIDSHLDALEAAHNANSTVTDIFAELDEAYFEQVEMQWDDDDMDVEEMTATVRDLLHQAEVEAHDALIETLNECLEELAQF